MEMREGDEYGERDGGREGDGVEEFNECTLRTLNRKAGALVALKCLNGSTDFFSPIVLAQHMEHKCDGNMATRCFPCCPRFFGLCYLAGMEMCPLFGTRWRPTDEK